MIKITLQGASEIVKRLQKVKDGDKQAGAIIGQHAKAYAAAARAAAPKKTGKLAKGIVAEEVGPMSWVVRSNVDYYAFQAHGTQKHNYPIFPRNKKALFWAGLPHPIAYVKSHPGIRPKPFGWLPAKLAQQNINNLAGQIAAVYSRVLGGG